MKTDFWYDSQGGGRIHACQWAPEGAPIGVLQIVHGIAEYAARYDHFAKALNAVGYLVVAEDHMGHGLSIGRDGVPGSFQGGWFTAVEDCYALLKNTRKAFSSLPYVLMGHSMGSFMVRTILAKHPDSGISACVICGTGWQPKVLLAAGLPLCTLECKRIGEKAPSPMLNRLIFGGYNKRVERPRTKFDWLSRNGQAVDAYIEDPLCGFVPSAGLFRDLLTGVSYIQQADTLLKMKKDLPVLFVAGGDDPVGNYGKAVKFTAEQFEKAGMERLSVMILPLYRHEILNEINREDAYHMIITWLSHVVLLK